MLHEPVGTRSPGALAELMVGDHLDWAHVADPVARAAEILDLPVASLGAPDSPLYARTWQACDHHYRAEGRGGAPPALRALFEPQVAAGPGQPQPWVYAFARGRPVVDGPTGHDPVQGCARNCYLFAAMSALAAAGLPIVTGDPAPSQSLTSPGLDVTLYVPDPVPMDVDAWLPHTLGGRLVYGHSRDPDETWPALLERAVLLRRVGQRGGSPPYDFGPEGLTPSLRLLGGRPCGALWEGDRPLAPETGRAVGVDGVVLRAATAASRPYRSLAGCPLVLPSHAYTVFGWVEGFGRAGGILLRDPFPGRAHGGVTGRDGTVAQVRASGWRTAWDTDPHLVALGIEEFTLRFDRIVALA